MQRLRWGRPVLSAVALALTACGGGLRAPLPPRAVFNLLRYGPERTQLNYHDRWGQEKQVLLEEMNRDRAAAGAPALVYEPRAALVGDRFCLEMALTRSTGYFDPHGRAPHVRWGLAGGTDFHAENAVAFSDSSGGHQRSTLELLLDAHRSMMAERAPDDSRRRLILDPTFTHVGIGVAIVGGEFRMSQEFTRVLFEWIEIPDRTLPAGSLASFGGQPLPDWRIAEVEIRWSPPLPDAPVSTIRSREGYELPDVIRRLRASPPEGLGDSGSGEPDFQVERSGRFAVNFPLDAGEGFYTVVCLLEPLPQRPGTRELVPGTAALLAARP